MNRKKKQDSINTTCSKKDESIGLSEGSIASVMVQQRYHNELVKYQEQILKTKLSSGEDKAA